jgi:hypothetical protein
LKFDTAATWMRLEPEICSLRSIDKLVRAAFPSPLKHDESRGHITVSIDECPCPRADAGAHAGGGG